jgi:hypothetical protein
MDRFCLSRRFDRRIETSVTESRHATILHRSCTKGQACSHENHRLRGLIEIGEVPVKPGDIIIMGEDESPENKSSLYELIYLLNKA